MAKHEHDRAQHDEHDENCIWCKARAEREKNKERVIAMKNAVEELLACDLSCEEGEDSEVCAKRIHKRIAEIEDKLKPWAVDAHDALLIAAHDCYERGKLLGSMANEWVEDMEAFGLIPGNKTIQ